MTQTRVAQWLRIKRIAAIDQRDGSGHRHLVCGEGRRLACRIFHCRLATASPSGGRQDACLPQSRDGCATRALNKRLNERGAARAYLRADQFRDGAFGQAATDRLIEKG